jgi:hypothetical protein
LRCCLLVAGRDDRVVEGDRHRKAFRSRRLRQTRKYVLDGVT